MAEALRMDFTRIAPDVYKHLLQIEGQIAGKLDKKLLHLIKMRATDPSYRTSHGRRGQFVGRMVRERRSMISSV